MTARVVHFEVPFDDADRALAFYRDVFDWEIQPMPEMNYNMVSTGITASASSA
jgi:predicted enzyme related to lactoylglutathione lyase